MRGMRGGTLFAYPSFEGSGFLFNAGKLYYKFLKDHQNNISLIESFNYFVTQIYSEIVTCSAKSCFERLWRLQHPVGDFFIN